MGSVSISFAQRDDEIFSHSSSENCSSSAKFDGHDALPIFSLDTMIDFEIFGMLQN